jgi:nicotinate-nucleotide pyrophosphorylase (carboxylating)
VDALGDRVSLEASGGVTLDNVRAYAEAGAQRISIGALTHSAPCADVALELEDDAAGGVRA